MSALKLNLGCGSKRLDGYLNVDKYGDPELRVDLEKFPWPWPDNSIAKIELSHVLEHLGQQTETYLQIIQELYRICQPQAEIHVVVPHHRHDFFVHDPTHVRPITPYGLSMFSQKFNRECQAKGYSTTPLGLYLGVDFEVVETTYIPGDCWPEFAGDRADDVDYLLKQSELHNNLIQEVDMTLIAVKSATDRG